MSDLLRTIASYVPFSLAQTILEANDPRPPVTYQVKHFEAAVLFADVFGFTPLTEALGQKGSEGPEELTRLLNRYFGWMVAFIEAEGGEIVKFGGDALTVVFPATDEALPHATRRALQTAKTMQTSMDEFAIMETSVGLVTLQLKCGIGAGKLMSAQVGGVEDRWEYIISGDALFQATRAERQATRGQIILSPTAKATIYPEYLSPHTLIPPNWDSITDQDAVKSALRCYVPRPVLVWLEEELHEWLATLRPMSVLFVGINGLDYDQPDTVKKLHNFVCGAQTIIYNFQGSLPRLTVDDKGTVLLILFGAPPYSHQDDPERAVRCALGLQQLAQSQQLQLAIGVTTGRVFAGPVGGFTRREYTVMGDTVNLAARLMVVAGPGQVRCNYETYRSAYEQLGFEHLRQISVKGKTEKVDVYRPIGDLRLPEHLAKAARERASVGLVGRQSELKELLVHLDRLQAGNGGVVLIEGEAGIGKTELVTELINRARLRKLEVLLGIGRSIEQKIPYRAWRDLLLHALGNPDHASLQELVDIIWAKIESVNPDLLKYLFLLNDIYPLGLPESSVTAVLTDTARYQKLAAIILSLLGVHPAAQPLILVVEDAQWLDSASWHLAAALPQLILDQNLPMLFVLVTRPFENANVQFAQTVPQVHRLRLDTLSADDTLALVAGPLGLTGNELPESVAELIRDRAGGNPFFAEELFYSLHQNGFITFKTMQNKRRCLISGELARAAQSLPATILSTILARLDQLPPEKQLMLKVGAVIGQVFAFTTLRDTLKKTVVISEGELITDLNDLTYLGFIQPENSGSNLTYSFKHAIIREVTYQSLLFDRRRQLHRMVAEWYETTFSPDTHTGLIELKPDADPHLPLTRSLPPASVPLAPFYTLMVYHWHQAEDEAKEQFYAGLVGKQAVAQYANAEAMGYLRRALDLTPESNIADRFSLLMASETVYNRRGDRERQEISLSMLQKIVAAAGNSRWTAEFLLRKANFDESVGNYMQALRSVKMALPLSRQIGDPALEGDVHLMWAQILLAQGLFTAAQNQLDHTLAVARTQRLNQIEAKSLLNAATIYLHQGKYTHAESHCEHALHITDLHHIHMQKAQSLNLLGRLEYYQSDYEDAHNLYEQAAPVYFVLGSQRGKMTTLYNIGMLRMKQGQFEAARDYLEFALDIAREIGHREGVAASLTELGFLYTHLGDYTVAQGYIGQALGIRKEIGNIFGEADSLSKLGVLYYHQGENQTTRRYCDLALQIQQKLDAAEGESFSQTYLGHALSGMKKFAAAETAYEKALQLRAKMGQQAAAIDAKAGLAYASLANNKTDRALSLVEEILGWINSNGIVGINDPFLAYLHLYQTLSGAGQDDLVIMSRAEQVLATAQQVMQSVAAGITDQKLQNRFLNKGRIHQILAAYHKGHEPPPQIPEKQQGKTKESFSA